LGIPAAILEKPGPVSQEVAKLMAQRVLDKTPEADVAISVTGHLGPDAPPKLDGRVYIGIARRGRSKNHGAEVTVHPLQCGKDESRAARQRWVVERALNLLGDRLESERSR